MRMYVCVCCAAENLVSEGVQLLVPELFMCVGLTMEMAAYGQVRVMWWVARIGLLLRLRKENGEGWGAQALTRACSGGSVRLVGS